MTKLQKQFEEVLAQLHLEEKEFDRLHKKAEEMRKNVIIPLRLEMKSLLVQVHGERKSNYNIKSD